LHTQSLEFYEGVIKQTDASSALMRQQLSEATAENLELQRLIMNQDVHKHETDTKLRIMEVSVLQAHLANATRHNRHHSLISKLRAHAKTQLHATRPLTSPPLD
jgi:hypothetical protein